MTNQYDRLLHQASEALRRQGTDTNRHGVVDKVEEKGGERKALITWGYTPDGKPCQVWSSSQENRSGQHRSQDSVKPGQNVTMQGPDYRQASFTPQAEAEHAPQPKHAPKINGQSQSVGKKLRIAHHGGQDDQQQSGSGGGGAGGDSSGGGGGGQQQQYEKEHYSASWIAKEDEKLKKYTPGSGKATSSKSGSQSSMSGAEQPQQKEEKEEQEERAMQQVMHEKEGLTGVIGKGDDGVRYAAHPKGAKIRAGSENYVVAEKDKHTYVYAQKDVYVRALEKHYVADAWIIKKGPKDPVPNHDLGSS